MSMERRIAALEDQIKPENGGEPLVVITSHTIVDVGEDGEPVETGEVVRSRWVDGRLAERRNIPATGDPRDQ